MSGNDDNSVQKEIVINELGVLKTSTVEGRGTNYILTCLSAEQIGELLTRRRQDSFDFTQDAKNPAKFTIEIMTGYIHYPKDGPIGNSKIPCIHYASSEFNSGFYECSCQ